jgi:50S ribosomal protein L16 3-hydroxylase
MNDLADFDAGHFLSHHWQRKPLLLRNALPGFVDPLDPDELAGLALEPDIESRLVLYDNACQWQVEHGPLDSTRFNALHGNWTLLVQATDHVSLEVSELLNYFRFLPEWRIDDVMASYAPCGGGVGPHFDRYDVFLIQGSGSRRWRLGQRCDENSKLIPHPELKILDNFELTADYTLHTGDILYVPPGVAHWGESIEDAVTWSIGFRGPSQTDLLSHFCDHLLEYSTSDHPIPDPDVGPRYSPTEILAEDLDVVRTTIMQLVDNPHQLAQWYGSLVTEPKYADEAPSNPEPGDPESIAVEDQLGALQRAPDSRLAYTGLSAYLLLFYDGRSMQCPSELQAMIKYLCDNKYLDPARLIEFLSLEGAREVMATLLAAGVFYDAGE